MGRVKENNGVDIIVAVLGLILLFGLAFLVGMLVRASMDKQKEREKTQ